MLEGLNLTTEQLEAVQKYVQGETDKVRTKYSKQIKDLENKVPKEKSEDEINFEKRLKDLEIREQEITKKELLTNAKGILNSKGLNSQLADFINLEGVEDLETYITNITDIIGKQVTNNYIPKGHEKAKGNITKEQFKNMSYTERCNLYESNKQLYDILSK